MESARHLFRSLKKKISTQSSTDTTATQPAPLPRTRRATLTDSSTVANAFNSGDSDAIGDIMKKHMVRVMQSRSVKQGSQTFGVREAHVDDRTSDTGELRTMKTFELFGNPGKGDPTITATYFPMTGKADAWEGSPGDKTLKQDDVKYTQQQQRVAVTTPLSGCAVVERADGDLAHVQPFDTGVGSTDRQLINQTTAKATQRLKQKPQHADVFGPDEYGMGIKDGLPHRTTNVLVVKDQQGNQQALSQTVYGNKYGNNQIVFNQRTMAPRENLFVSPPTSAPTATATTSTSDHHLQVPVRQDPFGESMPMPLPRTMPVATPLMTAPPPTATATTTATSTSSATGRRNSFSGPNSVTQKAVVQRQRAKSVDN